MKFVITSTKYDFFADNLYRGYPWLSLCDYVSEENFQRTNGEIIKVLTLSGDEKQVMNALEDMAKTFDKRLILYFGCKNYLGCPLVEIYDTWRE